MVGYIDGDEFHATSGTSDAAERQFCHIARRAWVRRTLRTIGGLPARERQLMSSADTYHDVSIGRVLSLALWTVPAAVAQYLSAMARRWR